MTNYIFLGAPGSGKGTQAQKLAAKINAFYFGTGDMLREEANKGTDFGKKFKEIWDRGQGELIPSHLVTEFVVQKVKDISNAHPIVFDSYPRSLVQAKEFEEIVPNNDLLVIFLDVSENHLVERLSTRRVCESCGKIFFRPDLSGQSECDVCGGKLIQRQEDSSEVIKKRIAVYEAETRPLVDYYKDKNILISVDGTGSIDEVEKEITNKINERKSNN